MVPNKRNTCSGEIGRFLFILLAKKKRTSRISIHFKFNQIKCSVAKSTYACLEDETFTDDELMPAPVPLSIDVFAFGI